MLRKKLGGVQLLDNSVFICKFQKNVCCVKKNARDSPPLPLKLHACNNCVYTRTSDARAFKLVGNSSIDTVYM